MDKRLARGDKGINQLDAACREHDIFYADHTDSEERHKADLKLKSLANQRILARDSSIGERLAAVTVSAAMKAKTSFGRIGSGLRRMIKNKRKKTTKRNDITFSKLVSGVRINMRKSKPKTVQCAVKAGIAAARKLRSGKRITKIPRIIKVPSISGGLLPIIPVLSGLAATGTIANTLVNVVKALKSIRNNDGARNVQTKLGAGLYLTTAKHGRGLYLRPYPKN